MPSKLRPPHTYMRPAIAAAAAPDRASGIGGSGHHVTLLGTKRSPELNGAEPSLPPATRSCPAILLATAFARLWLMGGSTSHETVAALKRSSVFTAPVPSQPPQTYAAFPMDVAAARLRCPTLGAWPPML